MHPISYVLDTKLSMHFFFFLLNPFYYVLQQYDRYFAANSVEKGGSFYLQSKVVRAKEMLDDYIKEKKLEETQQQQR
jgi:hypothetical protein